MNINIGADELILWLKKNSKCLNISHIELGKKIANIMDHKLNAERVESNSSSLWYRDIDVLTKTYQQYSVSTKDLEALFNELNNW